MMKDIYLERENKFRKISVHSAMMISRQGPLSLSLLQQEFQVCEISLVYPYNSQVNPQFKEENGEFW